MTSLLGEEGAAWKGAGRIRKCPQEFYKENLQPVLSSMG